VQEKIKAGYYPQENGERKPLSKWHWRHPEPEQRRKFGAVRTRQEREGSEKAQPDVGALQSQIQELLDEKQQTLEKDEKNPTGASQLPDHDRTNVGRNPRTSQNGRGIWFQHSELEERDRRQKASKQGARTQEP